MGRGVPVAMEEVEQMEALYATGLSSRAEVSLRGKSFESFSVELSTKSSLDLADWLYSSSEDSTRCVRKYNAVAGVLSRRGRV
jgi:hypothetical protein